MVAVLAMTAFSAPVVVTTESGVPLDPRQPPPDWIALRDGKALGARGFARAVDDREMRQFFFRGNLFGYVFPATLAVGGSVATVVALADNRRPAPWVLPVTVGMSALGVGLGTWYFSATTGKDSLRRYYDADDAQAFAEGRPVDRPPIAMPDL